jgi:hypothetical protein
VFVRATFSSLALCLRVRLNNWLPKAASLSCLQVSLGACPREAPEWCSILIGYSLTHKHKTSLEHPRRDKHSSFSDPFINYSHKNSYNFATRSTRVTCLFPTQSRSQYSLGTTLHQFRYLYYLGWVCIQEATYDQYF